MTVVNNEWLNDKYQYPHGERVTPLDEIPVEYQRKGKLPNGQVQIIDMRIAYTFHPEYRDPNFPNGALLECVDVLMDEIAP